MWWIITIITAVIFILITVYILKDTHVKVYNLDTKLEEEYDLELPIWALLLIILVYLIPIINIVAFISFLVYYINHIRWNPEDWGNEVMVFSLNRNNWVTKSLLAIKEILNKKI